MRDRVIQAARKLGLEVAPTRLDSSTRTVSEASAAVGCAPCQIAKSIVFVADGEPVVVVASGAHRVDVDRLCDVLDVAEAHTASPEEVRAATGYSVGGVPPFGHGLPVVLDAALLEFERVWAAGGDGSTVMAVDPRKLAGCTQATVAPIGDVADDDASRTAA